MPFNIQTALTQSEQAFINMGIEKSGILLSIVSVYLSNATERLTLLNASWEADHDQQFVDARLVEEKQILTSEYLSLDIIATQLAAEAKDETITQVATVLINILAGLITKP